MTLHTLFTTSGKEGQMHLPFKAQDAAQKKGPIKCGGFCHLCRRAKSLGCRQHSQYPTSTPKRLGPTDPCYSLVGLGSH